MAEHWEEWRLPDGNKMFFNRAAGHGSASCVRADMYLLPITYGSVEVDGDEFVIEDDDRFPGMEVARAPTHDTQEEFIAWCRMVDALHGGENYG